MFNKKSLNVLKYIYEHPYTKSIIMSCMPNRSIDRHSVDEIIQNLASEWLISCRAASCKEADIDKAELDSTNPDAYLVCLPSGEAIIEQDIKFRKDIVITRIISIVALVISLIAMFIPPFLSAYFETILNRWYHIILSTSTIIETIRLITGSKYIDKLGYLR